MQNDDQSGMWWLGGDDSPTDSRGQSQPYQSEPFSPPSGPFDDEPVVDAPPPPPRGDPDSSWLRDGPTRGSEALYPPPSAPEPPYGEFPQTNFPRPSDAADMRGPVSSDRGSRPPRRRATTAAAAPPPDRKKGGGMRRTLLGLLALLLAGILAGLGVLKITTGSDGFFPNLGLGPTPTRVGYAKSAKITFTRATKDIAALSSTLVAATDGSGDIPAKTQNASVTGATSGAIGATFQPATQVIFNISISNTTNNPLSIPLGLVVSSANPTGITCTVVGNGGTIPAHNSVSQPCAEQFKTNPAAHWSSTDPGGYSFSGDSPAGGNTAYYYVPPSCGDSSPAQASARAALSAQLTVAGGTIIFYGPVFDIKASTLSCSPAAGTQQTTPFNFTQKIDGTATETTFLASDAQDFQTKSVGGVVPTNYVLVSASACPEGPKAGDGATGSKATITCPTTGKAGWDWKPAALSDLASAIAGSGLGSAVLELNSTPGVTPGSVKVDLVDGSELPQNADDITFAVVDA